MGILNLASRGVKGFGKNFASNMMGLSAGDLTSMYGLDVAFGIMQGAMTEGDLIDKLGVGALSATGGAMGGTALRSVPGIGGRDIKGKMGLLNRPSTRFVGDMIGSWGGDVAAVQLIGDPIQRMRHGGTTPFETAQAENIQMIQKEAVENYLRSQGLVS